MQLVESHLNALFQTALQLTPSRAEAEEVVCEVYLDALCDSRVELFKALIEQTRKRTQSSSAGVLSRLPVRLREVIVLVDCHGFSYRDAGEVLGVTPEVIQECVTRGRDLLQERVSTPA